MNWVDKLSLLWDGHISKWKNVFRRYPFLRQVNFKGKLLHIYYPFPTSMATDLLSQKIYTLQVSGKLSIKYLPSLTIEPASLDLLTKPQPT